MNKSQEPCCLERTAFKQIARSSAVPIRIRMDLNQSEKPDPDLHQLNAEPRH
jgi:hypothetical protein